MTALLIVGVAMPAWGQIRYPLPYPPKLPGDQASVTIDSAELLQPGPNLLDGNHELRVHSTGENQRKYGDADNADSADVR
jgi:hypothetical protein